MLPVQHHMREKMTPHWSGPSSRTPIAAAQRAVRHRPAPSEPGNTACSCYRRRDGSPWPDGRSLGPFTAISTAGCGHTRRARRPDGVVNGSAASRNLRSCSIQPIASASVTNVATTRGGNRDRNSSTAKLSAQWTTRKVLSDIIHRSRPARQLHALYSSLSTNDGRHVACVPDLSVCLVVIPPHDREAVERIDTLAEPPVRSSYDETFIALAGA